MALLLVLLLAGRVSDQAPWSEYEPSTLERIIEDHGGILDNVEEGDYVLDPGDRYRVTVRYLGNPRPIPGPRRAFLEAWARSVQRSQPVQDLFKTRSW